MKRTLLAALLLAFAVSMNGALFCATAAQTPATQANAAARRAGPISGVVTTDAGQPLADVTVYVRDAGQPFAFPRSALTDDAGRFRINDVPRGVYTLSPSAPGYVPVEAEPGGQLCRPGDTLRMTLTKGGVITGKVTNAAGEPLVGMRVHSVRTRDKDDHPLSSRQFAAGYESETDDRGVYRIFNLLPGTYVVEASGRSVYYGGASPYDEDIPTYYPSATRDTAQPVTVRGGEEIGDIDIRYRGERGHAISGAISGNIAGDPMRSGFDIRVFNATTGMFEAHSYGDPRNHHAFAVYGLADGDYVIVAQSIDPDRKTGSIGRARVKVKGADVTGVDVRTVSLASIAGSVRIEPLDKSEEKKCEIKRRALEEALLIVRRDDDKGNVKIYTTPWIDTYRRSAPQENGEFTLNNLEAGAYRLEVFLPSEDYFVRSITQPAAAKNQPPVDAARNPLAVKAGERLNSITVTMAEGAAALRGRVISATEGRQLPERLRVHLVPAEKAAADDVLRYYEAEVKGDSFELLNLSPGRYFVIARRADDDGQSVDVPRPVAWDTDARQRLRQRAEAANTVLELRPCQRMTDYSFKYAPTDKKTAAGGTQ